MKVEQWWKIESGSKVEDIIKFREWMKVEQWFVKVRERVKSWAVIEIGQWTKAQQGRKV